jgi:D-arginine utilization repressor
MKQSLERTLPFAETFAKLLHPFAEVVVHDLEEDAIVAIYNPFSRREVGDSSYLDQIDFNETSSVIGPYCKTNWDGRPLKSISTVVRNEKGVAEGFLCINVDLSAFTTAIHLLQTFSSSPPAESQELFKEDLYERVNRYVQKYCHEHQTTIDSLNRGEKQELIHALAAEGAFKERNAAAYVGRVLGLSRATVYNYLKEVS